MRLRALDWLRGLAVLVMVECHVFNALLAPEYRSATWFGVLNWLNGFVAPAFLLVSVALPDKVRFAPSWLLAIDRFPAGTVVVPL